MARRISSQKEFAAIKSKFNSGSDYREFKKRYFFHPESQIEKTGIPRNQVLRKQSGARWEIFGKMRTGLTVDAVYGLAKGVSRSAERDADVFIALYNGFIRLVP